MHPMMLDKPEPEEGFEPSSGYEKYNGGGSTDDGDTDLDDFGAAIAEAFPAEEWTPDRVFAMKEAIKICAQSDYAQKKDKPADKTGLALIFGSGKPKK